MRPLETLRLGIMAWGSIAVATVACTNRPPIDDSGTDTDTDTDTMSTGSTTEVITTTGPDTTIGPEDTTEGGPDLPGTDTEDPPSACGPEGCALDLLFVIDNSGTMGEEQRSLAGNFQGLVTELMTLTDGAGQPLDLDVNIMVTTTDMGHPLCTAFQRPDYEPRQGAPVYTGCNSRINRFTGLDPVQPVVITEACTDNCPVDVAPADHFIHFGPDGSNVPNDDVGTALACIGPQGIDGCGYESPLEAMLQAINEASCWNDPTQRRCQDDPEWADVTEGFLRDEAVLAVVLVTDELDCSVQAPSGYAYFTDVENPIYWNVNPQLEVPQATSAICFNAGVSCSDAGGDGIYESCVAVDNPALHPIDRYTNYLDYLNSLGKDVLMMGLLGVPEVTAHNPDPPFEPTAGGAIDLVYRSWVDGPYPMGDIPPDEWAAGGTADDKIFEFGALGPGCTGTDANGEITGQGLPPVRIREVCERLNSVDDEGNEVVRCCIESICDDDFSPVFRCITGQLAGPVF